MATAERHRATGVDMQHRAVLDIAVHADHDWRVIAAQHRAGPNAGAGFEDYVPDEGGAFGDIGGFVDSRGQIADPIKGHGSNLRG